MTQAVPLYAVLAVLAGLGFAYLLWRLAESLRESARRTAALTESVEALLKSAKEVRSALEPAAAEVKANLAALPQMLQALSRIASAQLEVMQAQRSAEEEKRKNPFGRPTGPIAPRDTDAANLEYEVSQMMRSDGVSREEALLRLNPANASSVWENNRIFEGWR